MTSETTKPRLSEAQARMVGRLEKVWPSRELCPGGQRDSGRQASAWYRTARSLERLGVAKLTVVDGGSFVRLNR